MAEIARRPRAPGGPRAERRVALVIESSNAYGRGLLRGIVRYVKDHARWTLHLVESARGQAAPDWLARWDGDGVLVRIENRRIAAAVRACGLPAVDLSAGRHVRGIPWVETDDRAIARLAFGHLAERGFRQFAFCGDARFAWSRDRGAAFAALCAAGGHPCMALPRRLQHAASGRQAEALAAWAAALPKPIGVFAAYDMRGQQLLDACRAAGVAVPDDLAVVGVDDDEIVCELAFPPLSSIAPNARLAGYRAAGLLDRLMRGEHLGEVEVRVPPRALAARQSTDVLAVADPAVARALRAIREHACERTSVPAVARAAGVSRRVLEKRFRAALGRSPHEVIRSVRLRRVRELLAESDLTIEAIAEKVGFEHPEYVSAAFRRELGMTPGAFRRASLGAASPRGGL